MWENPSIVGNDMVWISIRGNSTQIPDQIVIATPMVKANTRSKEENYLLWILKNGVTEGLIEIPKGTFGLVCFPNNFVQSTLCNANANAFVEIKCFIPCELLDLMKMLFN